MYLIANRSAEGLLAWYMFQQSANETTKQKAERQYKSSKAHLEVST